MGRSKVAHFSQCFPSGQHIRIGCYRPDGVDPDSMAACILLGNSDGVEPDSMAAHVLLGNQDGVKLDGSLHLSHAYGPLATSGYLIRNYVLSDMSESVDRIFHIRIP